MEPVNLRIAVKIPPEGEYAMSAQEQQGRKEGAMGSEAVQVEKMVTQSWQQPGEQQLREQRGWLYAQQEERHKGIYTF